MPLFSIIVPVFNVAKYLVECLNSIRKQVFKDFEVILINDGSTDKSANICDDFARNDSRFFVIHKRNGGVSLARQAGVEQAKGKYIVCVDGDDYVSQSFLNVFYNIIDKWEPDVICSGYYESSPDALKRIDIGYQEGYYNREQMIQKIFPSLIMSKDGKTFSSQLWAKAFKKIIYEQNQLKDQKVVMGEDIACSKSAIAQSHSLFITNEPLYFYRQNPNSVTKSRRVFPLDGPIIRGKHLLNKTKNPDFDFTEQIYRDVVISLFTVSRSLFYQDNKTNKKIKNEIAELLSNQFYSKALANAVFSNMKFRIIRFTLRHKLFWLMKLYNSIKRL